MSNIHSVIKIYITDVGIRKIFPCRVYYIDKASVRTNFRFIKFKIFTVLKIFKFWLK